MAMLLFPIDLKIIGKLRYFSEPFFLILVPLCFLKVNQVSQADGPAYLLVQP